MSTMPWARRRPIVQRDARPAARPESIDIWLDTLQGLAGARRAERKALAPLGRELRVRLDRQSR